MVWSTSSQPLGTDGTPSHKSNLLLPMLATPSTSTGSTSSGTHRSSRHLTATGSASEGLSNFTMGRRQVVSLPSSSSSRQHPTRSLPAMRRTSSGGSLDSGGRSGSDQERMMLSSWSPASWARPHPPLMRSKASAPAAPSSFLRRSLSWVGRSSGHAALNHQPSKDTFSGSNSLTRYREKPESYRRQVSEGQWDRMERHREEHIRDDEDEDDPDDDHDSNAPYEAPTRTTRRLDRTDLLPGGFKTEDNVRTLIKGMETPLMAGFRLGSRGTIVGTLLVKPVRGDVDVIEQLPQKDVSTEVVNTSSVEFRYKVHLSDGTHRVLSEYQICHPGIFRLVMLQGLPGGFNYGEQVQLLQSSLLTQDLQVISHPGLGSQGVIVGPASAEGKLSVHFEDDGRTWCLHPRMLARAGAEFKLALKEGLPGCFHRKDMVVKINGERTPTSGEDKNADLPVGARGQVLGPGFARGELLVLFSGHDRRSVPAFDLEKAPEEEPSELVRKSSKLRATRRLLSPGLGRSSPDASSGDELSPRKRSTSASGDERSAGRKSSSKVRMYSPWRLCKALLERS